jgi:hypothetical protein
VAAKTVDRDLAADLPVLRPARGTRRRLAELYRLVFCAVDEETGDPRLAARVARRAFLDAMADGLP